MIKLLPALFQNDTNKKKRTVFNEKQICFIFTLIFNFVTLCSYVTKAVYERKKKCEKKEKWGANYQSVIQINFIK